VSWFSKPIITPPPVSSCRPEAIGDMVSHRQYVGVIATERLCLEDTGTPRRLEEWQGQRRAAFGDRDTLELEQHPVIQRGLFTHFGEDRHALEITPQSGPHLIDPCPRLSQCQGCVGVEYGLGACNGYPGRTVSDEGVHHTL
jgi:hypothetical protein